MREAPFLLLLRVCPFSSFLHQEAVKQLFPTDRDEKRMKFRSDYRGKSPSMTYKQKEIEKWHLSSNKNKSIFKYFRAIYTSSWSSSMRHLLRWERSSVDMLNVCNTRVTGLTRDLIANVVITRTLKERDIYMRYSLLKRD